VADLARANFDNHNVGDVFGILPCLIKIKAHYRDPSIQVSRKGS